MQIPRAALDYLTNEVNALSSDAREKVSRLLDSIDLGAADTASARAALVDILIALMPTYTDAAAQAGADFYDALREAAAGEKLGAVAFSGFEPGALDGAVRAFVQDIVDGKPMEQFNRKVLDRIDRDIRRAPNMAVAESVRRDPLKPRYARVPSGGETCSFCLMLASRGAVYNTPEAASHAHPGCDCRIVPSFDGGCDIEGYDPDEIYNRWQLSLAGEKHSFREGARDAGRFPRISGDHSIEDDLAATNPRFSEGAEWQKNCQRCVGAYEMRRRGFDVSARPASLANGMLDRRDPLPNRLDPSGWPNMFEGAELEKIPGTTANSIRGRIERRMAEYGSESRAIVRVRYKKRYGGGGRVFIAEQVDGVTRFIDPQTGSSDCAFYFSMVSKGETEVLRVDDKKVTDLIGRAVM